MGVAGWVNYLGEGGNSLKFWGVVKKRQSPDFRSPDVDISAFGNATFGFPASFGGEKSGSVTKCRLFFQVNVVYNVNNRLTDCRQAGSVCIFKKFL